MGFWYAIGAGRVELSWIANGFSLRMAVEPERLAFPNHKSTREHAEFVTAEIEQGLADGSYIEVQPGYAHVINPLKVVLNKRGKHRLCLDLRYPNPFLPHINFKLETLERDGHNLVRRGDVCFTADLGKAYYSYAANHHAFPFMAFEWKGRHFCCVVMPFGASHAPFIFHKTMRVAVRLLRLLRIRVLNYLDDFCVCVGTEGADQASAFLQWFLGALGWRFSVKCDWTPRPRSEFLGFEIDCKAYVYRVPADKIASCLALVQRVRADMVTRQSSKLVSQLAGVIMSLKLAYPGVRVWTRALYQAAAVLRSRTALSPEQLNAAMTELDYWIWSLNLPERNGRAIRDPASDVIIWVDTGGVGWGAVCEGVHVAGVLDGKELGTSSTFRELRGLRAACSVLASRLTGRSLLVRMDSLAAVRNLTKGGAQSHSCARRSRPGPSGVRR